MRVAEWLALMDAVPENPDVSDRMVALAEAREANFAVAVPVTGGMDSTTLWRMALEAGLPALPYYVNVGQPYAGAELDAIAELLHVTPTIIDARNALHGPPMQHVIPRRNFVIIDTIATRLKEIGAWGEIWFGNLAGESPPARGDKSSAFFVGLSQHLAMGGPSTPDVVVVQPLRGMDKTDLVRWWDARGALDVLRRTKSCFDPEARACGRCQTCFRKLVAFRAAGHSTFAMFDTQEWQPFIDKYRPAMRAAVAAQDWSRYSPARCRDTLAVIDAIAPEGP